MEASVIRPVLAVRSLLEEGVGRARCTAFCRHVWKNGQHAQAIINNHG